MTVITFISGKGGTGKSSSTQNVGVCLVKQKKKVLVVDLDSQANLSMSFGMSKHNKQTITSLLLGENTFEEVLVKTPSGVHLIPGGLKNSLDEQPIGDMQDGLALLHNCLDSIDKKYDYVLIDCPNNISTLTINALLSSDYFFIPAEPEWFGFEGIDTLLDKAEWVKKYNEGLKCGGIFVTKYSPTYRKSLHHQIVEQLGERFPDLVMKTTIRDNIAISEAQITKQSVIEYAPASNGAKDYQQLTIEILERIQPKN